MAQLRFDERVAIVTGAGRGIGRGYALALAARGARVVVVDYGVAIDGGGSSAAPAHDVVREITDNGGQALPFHASVVSEEAASLIVAHAIDTFGRLDVVINNAGIHDPGPFATLTAAQFRTMMDVSFFGTVFVTQAAWPHFVRAGYGRVVNTVSEAMLGGIPELTSYGAAKGAVFGLTRNLATEGAGHGIKVNAVAPRAYTRLSATSTESLASLYSMPREMIEQINASMPPDLCAPAALFLAHESCRLTGEVLQVGMGGVSRIAVVHTPGISKDSLTAEDIAANLETILDIQEARVTQAASIE
ncbi:hypothetical protein A5641_13485 [Mycobacterium sp. 1554424.7]|nr:hypothetical protein A5641_13485 [Mycobacterium sp. 1554424.7]